MKNLNDSTFRLLIVLIVIIFNITIIYSNYQTTKQLIDNGEPGLEELAQLRIEDGTPFAKTNSGDHKVINFQEFNISYKGKIELEKEGKLSVVVSIKNGEATLKDYAVSEIKNGYPFAEFKDDFNNRYYIPYLSRRELSVW